MIINVTFSLLINLENVEKKKVNIKIIHNSTTWNIMFFQTYFTVNIHIHTKIGHECVQYFEICLNHFLEQIWFYVTAVTWNYSYFLYLVFPVKFKKINKSAISISKNCFYYTLFCSVTYAQNFICLPWFTYNLAFSPYYLEKFHIISFTS